MTATPSRRTGWLLLLIVALGLNLRPALTAAGPLLAEIRAATGIGFQGAALLTALPFLCIGAVALALPWLSRGLNEHRGMTVALGAIATACAWRLWIDDGSALIMSALLAGFGVAIIQALMPGLIKRWFTGQVPMVTGLYSAALIAGGGAAAVLSPPVAAYLDDWRAGLGMWTLPAVLALLVWWRLRPRETPASTADLGADAPVQHFFASRRGWLLAAYFGLINGGYTTMAAWLPEQYRQLGWSAQDSGGMLGLMTLFQTAAALGVPALIRHQRDRRPWLLGALLAQLAGFIGLLLLPQQWSTLWVALIGGGLGASFALCLTLALDHLPKPRAAGHLAAFMQGVGFIIAGLVPWLAGWLRTTTGDFRAAWLLLATTVLLMLPLTLRFAPAGYARAMAGRGSAQAGDDAPRHPSFGHRGQPIADTGETDAAVHRHLDRAGGVQPQ